MAVGIPDDMGARSDLSGQQPVDRRRDRRRHQRPCGFQRREHLHRHRDRVHFRDRQFLQRQQSPHDTEGCHAKRARRRCRRELHYSAGLLQTKTDIDGTQTTYGCDNYLRTTSIALSGSGNFPATTQNFAYFSSGLEEHRSGISPQSDGHDLRLRECRHGAAHVSQHAKARRRHPDHFLQLSDPQPPADDGHPANPRHPDHESFSRWPRVRDQRHGPGGHPIQLQRRCELQVQKYSAWLRPIAWVVGRKVRLARPAGHPAHATGRLDLRLLEGGPQNLQLWLIDRPACLRVHDRRSQQPGPAAAGPPVCLRGPGNAQLGRR